MRNESELADSIADEIEGNLFKLGPKQIANALTSIQYHLLADKCIGRFKELVSKAVKDEQIQ